MKMNYDEYTTTVSDSASYYGPPCSVVDADRIATNLAEMIRSQFPGITVIRTGSTTTGPDPEMIDEINSWIADNWTSAL